MGVTVVSEYYFNNDQSDYAKSLRRIYGEDGYSQYAAKMNSIMAKEEARLTNPLKASKERHIAAKKAAYEQALAKQGKAAGIWNHFKSTYAQNLEMARKSNNGVLTGELQRAALANCGDGAATALQNFNAANADVDETLSLYNDATHSGMAFNLLS